METNGSEPLMTCRNSHRWRRNRGGAVPGMKVEASLLQCSTGVRHEGGVNADQALVRNVGTCRPDAKGAAQAAQTARARVPMRGTGAEALVVGVKVL
jgi:hypothetical protein